MIKRIVKLTFVPQHREDFIQVFLRHQKFMEQYEPCLSLDLLEDIHESGVFFTYSTWESESALHEYRNSDYFRDIWGRVKPWFQERAMAWSTRVIR